MYQKGAIATYYWDCYAFWNCYCACTDSACRLAWSAALVAECDTPTAYGWDAVLGLCGTECAGQDVAQVRLPDAGTALQDAAPDR
jgi:hypothetical protein